jgi:ATP-dependent DNA helicase PIF1
MKRAFEVECISSESDEEHVVRPRKIRKRVDRAALLAKRARLLDWQQLSVDQREAIEYVLADRTRSVFLTGEAGSGKTRLLRYLIAELDRRRDAGGVFTTAFTGAAALLIGGRTLNSFAGIGLADKEAKEYARFMKKEVRDRWRACHTLIIDEISMVDQHTFDLIDQVARLVREKNVPFGGVRLIMAGDMAQIPPVAKAPRIQHFAFEARAWGLVEPRIFNFTYSHRQAGAPEFGQLLSNVRMGVCTDAASDAFMECLARQHDSDALITYMFPHRARVDTMNASKLAELPGSIRIFEATEVVATEKDRERLKDLRAPMSLELKLGAQVMLLKNISVRARLVNGSVGTVKRIEENYLVINFPGCDGSKARIDHEGKEDEYGEEYDLEDDDIELTRTCFEVRERDKTSATGDRLVASRTQFPIMLAYAMTVHVAQGQTITNPIVADIGSAFEFGQAYVVLSRIQRIEQLALTSFEREKIKAHPEVISFYEKLREINTILL